MRHVCAYLLAAMGTNAANAANMKAILASVGVEADDKQLEIVIQKFGNKNIEKVIAEGKEGIKSGFFFWVGGDIVVRISNHLKTRMEWKYALYYFEWKVATTTSVAYPF